MREAKNQLQTLQRAFDVLRIVSESRRPLSMSEIAEALGTGTTIVFRILKSLEANDYLYRGADKRYRCPSHTGTARTLAEGLRLLQEVAAGVGPGVTPAHLAERMGLSERQVLATLGQLEEAGLVEGSPGGNWTISPAILSYARPVLNQTAQLAALRPVMTDLAERYEETVTRFCRAGWRQIVAEAIPSPHPVRYVLEVGAGFPLYVGAAGKAHLANLPTSETNAYLADLEPEALTRYRVDPEVLRQELTVIRARGYATSVSERVEGAASVAAAVIGPDGEVVGVIGIMAPLFRTSPAKLALMGDDLAARTRGLFGGAFGAASGFSGRTA